MSAHWMVIIALVMAWLAIVLLVAGFCGMNSRKEYRIDAVNPSHRPVPGDQLDR